MSNIDITNPDITSIFAGTETGFGTGLNKVTYNELNLLRVEMFQTDQYINVLRDEDGSINVFRGIMPPVITTGAVTTGCVKLPDPNCFTIYEFLAKIDQERITDTVIPPCEAAHLANQVRNFIADSVAMWSRNEAKAVFNFIGTSVGTATNVASGTNIREAINNQILALEKDLYTELGDYMPSRDRFVVLLSQNAVAQLQNSQFVCCNWNMVEANPLSNLFGVKFVADIPLNLMPSGFDIIVYVPEFAFLKTQCYS